MMTTSFEKAFATASNLPPDLQEQLASQMLADIKGELSWDKTLISSQNLLEKMASKALTKQRRGKTSRISSIKSQFRE
jgi:hypothetical protein